MPTYQYECQACGFEFEELQSMTDPKLKRCPKCKKDKLHRLIGTGGGIIFKGTGFYETDYKNKGASTTESSSSSGCGSSCGCHPAAGASTSESKSSSKKKKKTES